MTLFSNGRGLPLAAAFVLALAIAACAKNPADDATAGLNVGGVGAPGSQQDFATNVGDRVFFETDSSELTPTATATLDKQAIWLSRYNRYTFTVAGHADERGTREYNFALGARRAETVKNYLVAKGISSARMKTISYGKERPVAVCDDISCWSQNRRVVTELAATNS
jgi:peptidoglycan-associated lipoprotein